MKNRESEEFLITTKDVKEILEVIGKRQLSDFQSYSVVNFYAFTELKVECLPHGKKEIIKIKRYSNTYRDENNWVLLLEEEEYSFEDLNSLLQKLEDKVILKSYRE